MTDGRDSVAVRSVSAMSNAAKKALPEPLKRRAKVLRARGLERLGRDALSYPALNGLDRKVIPRLPERGVFLEIGANDGYSQSNTYQLSRRGWTGILVEPVPSLFKACRRTRRESQCFNVACGAPGGPDAVTIVDLNLMSTVVGVRGSVDQQLERAGLAGGRRVEVPSTTLSAVIDEAGNPAIDFISVDVEGLELEVLSGLDLARHAPGHLLIETTDSEAASALLAPWMRQVEQLGSWDYLFRRAG